MKITNIEFGERLKKCREFLEITQKQLAKECNTKQVSISNLENGRGGFSTIIKVLEFYSQHIYINMLFEKVFIPIAVDSNKEVIKNILGNFIKEYLNQIYNETKENQKKELNILKEKIEIINSLL